MPEDVRKNVGLQPLNHERLKKMKAQAVLFGYQVRSADDAVDLLLQLWDRVTADADRNGLRKLHSLVRPPTSR